MYTYNNITSTPSPLRDYIIINNLNSVLHSSSIVSTQRNPFPANMSLHDMTQILAFPLANHDTPLDDEQLVTHRKWAVWATGQGHPDIP